MDIFEFTSATIIKSDYKRYCNEKNSENISFTALK